MKNKKGFTLIELLAVIVILAIIALIATPIILNMIESAKKGASKDSAYGYIEAIEYNNSIADLGLNNNYTKIPDGEDLDVTGLEVKIKGTKPESGTVTIEKGNVKEAELCINGYIVLYDGKEAKVDGKCNGTIEYKKYENGTAIYYNPVTGKICGDYTKENSKTGVTEGCLKWYIFNDDKTSSTVNMILDHNTTALTAWVSLDDYIEAGGTEEEYGEKGNNNKGPLTATKRLKEDTKNWENKARLISADEVAKITGANEVLKWDSSKTYGTDDIETQSAYFYLDGSGTTYSSTDGWQKRVATSQGASKYAWLYDNTYGCTSRGCNVSDDNKYEYGKEGDTDYIYGYWTSTVVSDNSIKTWRVSFGGYLDNYTINYENINGVRPVITVSKKNIYTQYKEEILKGTDPVYSNNLIPVIIADNGTVTKADVTKEWYKYENKKWANAVILTDTGKIEEDGTIKEESIESYFVWIPRYKYKLFDLGNYTSYIEGKPETSNAKEIEIVFGTDTTSDSNTGECTTPGISGETGNCEVGEYMTHPAFLSFNTTGLWVGKFETTGTIDDITVKPGIKSLSNQIVKAMFDASYNYKKNNESHMMKNTEWGAVTYLSYSKYGINKEININNNSDYLTGYSAVEGTDQSKYPGINGNDSSVTLAYNTNTGYKASTTGNITGVYDMSGGSSEYMASYMDGEYGESNFESDPITTYGKEYFDKYNNPSTWISFNNRILGDATGEFGQFYRYNDGDEKSRIHNSWYMDSFIFLNSVSPFFVRGGFPDNGILAGTLNVNSYTGNSLTGIGFRLVLTK